MLYLPELHTKKSGIDTELAPYVKEYRNIIGVNNYNYKFKRLSMNFVDLKYPAVGRCWWLIDGGYEIEIDQTWWNRVDTSFNNKQLTVYHELEHCIRFRMHTNRTKKIENITDVFDEIGYYLGIIPKPGYFKDGCPISLMDSHVINEQCELKYYSHYIKEMIDLK